MCQEGKVKKVLESEKLSEHMHFLISESMHEKLQKAAKSKGILSVSALIRMWLNEKLKEEKIK